MVRKYASLPFLFFVIMLLPAGLKAQPKALFVNDNGLIKANTDTVLMALTACGFEYDVFNARDSLRSPTAVEMQAYPLVIWYCSTDGVKNYLWNANDTDNNDLTLYLETGGRLWLMGTDFLYDRYGSPPDNFQPGDFVYDYLGISAYNVQSYGDDGGLGVPVLEYAEQPGSSPALTQIQWIYSTAWWVDGCTPAETAVTNYTMGPGSYPLSGFSSAVSNHYFETWGSKEITFLFDPAIMDFIQNRITLFTWAYSVLFMVTPGFDELPPTEGSLIAGPNPTTGKLRIRQPECMTGKPASISISDISGRQMAWSSIESNSLSDIDISSLSSGIYVLQITDGIHIFNQKFIVNQ